MWLITSDGRAFNLAFVRRIEVSGDGDQLTLTGYVDTPRGEGSVASGTELSQDVADWVLARLIKGEGVDLREHEPPGIIGVDLEEE